ncbi:MAG: hypothetical protein E5X34_02880 [Mesorhizobium sp.]|uniref:hypothetical protein n=1 Tax=Mesorhizobium sp. TaxID=1871066 RepID=UPI001203A521|nr:hypothetical protein [Mesorhizobium sp.]TIR26598.1 MAG: hypothetical protein E5X34_02880 [Mesorhizobium sp.]
MIPINPVIEAMARSDAKFDGRDFDSLGRTDRHRYLARSLAALKAIRSLDGAEVDRPLREIATIAEVDEYLFGNRHDWKSA